MADDDPAADAADVPEASDDRAGDGAGPADDRATLRDRIPTLPAPLDQIGSTPLLRLERAHGGSGGDGAAGPGLRLPDDLDVAVLAKAEWTNPGGSVKDRPALAMALDGLDRGALGPDAGTALIDATSGNTGIAYALCGAVLGFDVTLVMPENVSDERKRILAAYGADAVYTDALEGQDGAIERVRAMADEDPGRWFYPDQYSNPRNPAAHRETTGPELWEQTGGRISHLVCGLGTTGTAMGTGAFLREAAAEAGRDPPVVVGVEPDSGFHGIEGLKHLETSLVPPIFEDKAVDVRASVQTEAAYDACRRLARRGLLVGQSAGGVLAAIEAMAPDLEPGSVVCGIFADGADKYWSTGMWDGE